MQTPCVNIFLLFEAQFVATMVAVSRRFLVGMSCQPTYDARPNSCDAISVGMSSLPTLMPLPIRAMQGMQTFVSGPMADFLVVASFSSLPFRGFERSVFRL